MKSPLIISQIATDLRELLEIDNADVVSDIVEVIQKKGGYHYCEESFDDDFSGYCEYIGKGEYVIGFNKDRDFGLPFKRFTIAHELGHISIPDHQKSLFEYQKLHRSYEKNQYDEKELEADSFAAHFLAPSNACRALIPSMDLLPENIRKLSEHFIISLYASALRIVDLTDACCTIIVCNENGKTEYEKRSPLLESVVSRVIPYVHKTKIHEYSLMFDFINRKRDTEICRSQLNYWYASLPNDFYTTEAVIDLGYKGKFMALLTIETTELEEYVASVCNTNDSPF